MKHEIEIPGLPRGWRAVAYRRLENGDFYLNEQGEIVENYSLTIFALIVEKIKPHRIALEETGRWHINSTEGYVLVPAGSLIDMIDIEETQPDWMCYKVVEEE